MATRLRQSMREFEEAFLEQTEADRQRREEITRATTIRTHTRRLEKQHKHGTLRFVLLLLLLIATAARGDDRDVRDALHGHGLEPQATGSAAAVSCASAGLGGRRRRRDDRGGVALLLDLEVDLLAEHRDVPRSLDARPAPFRP